METRHSIGSHWKFVGHHLKFSFRSFQNNGKKLAALLLLLSYQTDLPFLLDQKRKQKSQDKINLCVFS
jgi:hypothetical protein